VLNTEESHINVDIILANTVLLKYTSHKEIYFEMMSVKICKNMSRLLSRALLLC